jgi:GNAT superfamily N-acetyltransferase
MPAITARDYAGPDDLRAMQTLTQACWTRDVHLHIGDHAWQHYPRQARADCPSRLWFDGDEVVAWATFGDGFKTFAHPGHVSLYDEALDWAEAACPEPVLETAVFERQTALVGALARRGYVERQDAPFGLHTFRTLKDIPQPELPAGFAALSMVEIGDVERKVAGHRASWSRFAAYDPADPPLVSGMTVERYRDLMRTWPYRPDLDFGIEAPDGRIVASCTAWLDDANQVGLFEPVGVDPAFRRLGFSRAMCFAALHALKAAGATLVTVKPRGDAAYPVPRHAYATMGFVAEGRQRVFARNRLA